MLRTKSWLGTSAAVVALAVGMLATGCGSDDKKSDNPVTPPPFATPPATLNGAWVTDINQGTLNATINNGAFEMKVNDAKFSKGTCLTSNANFKLTISHIHGDVINAAAGLPAPVLNSDWYTKDEFTAALNNIKPILTAALGAEEVAELEKGINVMFKEQTGTYKLEQGFLYVSRTGEGPQKFRRPQQ